MTISLALLFISFFLVTYSTLINQQVKIMTIDPSLFQNGDSSIQAENMQNLILMNIPTI